MTQASVANLMPAGKFKVQSSTRAKPEHGDTERLDVLSCLAAGIEPLPAGDEVPARLWADDNRVVVSEIG